MRIHMYECPCICMCIRIIDVASWQLAPSWAPVEHIWLARPAGPIVEIRYRVENTAVSPSFFFRMKYTIYGYIWWQHGQPYSGSQQAHTPQWHGTVQPPNLARHEDTIATNGEREEKSDAHRVQPSTYIQDTSRAIVIASGVNWMLHAAGLTCRCICSRAS